MAWLESGCKYTEARVCRRDGSLGSYSFLLPGDIIRKSASMSE